jgi:hypothetical protein
MSCEHLERTLALVDGELQGALAEAACRHLEACAECAEERRHLEALLARAAALPRELEPTRDLWPGIAARLQGGVRVLGFPRRAEPRRRASRPLGLLAAAAALVAVSSSVTAVLVRPEPKPERDAPDQFAVAVDADPLLRAERDYERAAAELMAAIEERRDLLAPQTREAIESSLSVMDRALLDLRTALESDPGNRELARLFNTTHRKRVDLLREAVRLSQS